MMVADPTNVAIDLVLGTAMLIVYSGSCQNGRVLLAKWQDVVERHGAFSLISLIASSNAGEEFQRGLYS
jgi:hypothetical protein